MPSVERTANLRRVPFAHAVPRALRLTVWLLPLLLLWSGCGGVPAPRPEPRPSVSGSIAAPGLVRWPAGAVLELRLVDFTAPDAPAVVVAEQTMSTPAGPPLRFRLPYDPRQIDPRRDYGIECRVRVAGRVRWALPQIFPVLTRDRAIVVELNLQSVPGRAGETDGR